LLKNLSNQI